MENVQTKGESNIWFLPKHHGEPKGSREAATLYIDWIQRKQHVQISYLPEYYMYYFRAVRCTQQATTHHFSTPMCNGQEVDVTAMDFSIAFDDVQHESLIVKLGVLWHPRDITSLDQVIPDWLQSEGIGEWKGLRPGLYDTMSDIPFRPRGKLFIYVTSFLYISLMSILASLYGVPLSISLSLSL